MPKAPSKRIIMTNRQLESWRMGIRVGKIRNRLEKHIFGEIEMTATQVRAAEILLRKVIPDLSATEHSGSIEQRHVTEYSDAELLGFLARIDARERGERVVGEAAGAGIPAVVHGVHDAELEGVEDPPRH